MLARRQIVGINFNLIAAGEVVGALRRWIESSHRGYVALANPHSVLAAHRDQDFRKALLGADITLPDGVGITLAARLLGCRDVVRVAGPGLMLDLCDSGRQHAFRHYFYGGREGVAAALATRLTARYEGLEIAGTCCPPFRRLTPEEDSRIVQTINATRPDIVWVGLGTGTQEKWMAAHVGRIEAAALIGVGAAFDFHAGTVPWAPAWIRNAGLEWAYRLVHEPRRLWRRNLDSPVFLARVIAQRLASASD